MSRKTKSRPEAIEDIPTALLPPDALLHSDSFGLQITEQERRALAVLPTDAAAELLRRIEADQVATLTPFEYLLRCMRNTAFSAKFRAQCAMQLMPYVHKKAEFEPETDSPVVKPDLRDLMRGLTDEELIMLERIARKMAGEQSAAPAIPHLTGSDKLQ